MRIVLGVSGGIAAYKAVLVLRLLREAGHRVRVVPTRDALRFVGAPTWEALSGERATPEVFEDVEEVAHVRLGREADLVLVAPATADLLARLAAGRADDLLTATLLTAQCPVLVAPAMHTEMWRHPATVENVATLRRRGVVVLDPEDGRLTGTDSGPGRLPEPDTIVRNALALVGSADLAGLRVVVSAGGTQEPIDPVRFLGNRSSGRQGVALARAARDRGAEVTLVGAHLQVPAPPGVEVLSAGTAAELRETVLRAAASADVVVMAAAVADFRPVRPSDSKLKKSADAGPPRIELVENPDILVELAGERRRPGQTVVGFAAETGDAAGTVLEHGRAKARRKGADLLVVNPVQVAMGADRADNDAVILDGTGGVVGTARGSKEEVADRVWDAVLAVRAPGGPAGPVVSPAGTPTEGPLLGG